MHPHFVMQFCREGALVWARAGAGAWARARGAKCNRSFPPDFSNDNLCEVGLGDTSKTIKYACCAELDFKSVLPLVLFDTKGPSLASHMGRHRTRPTTTATCHASRPYHRPDGLGCLRPPLQAIAQQQPPFLPASGGSDDKKTHVCVPKSGLRCRAGGAIRTLTPFFFTMASTL